jgi:myo-inositol-1(or 4)-monophosphatase
MSANFTEVMQKCVKAVQEAGDFQLKHFRTMPAGYGDEKDVREMVSFVDVESEKILKAQLMPLVDGAGFYGEESGQEGSMDLTWVVDPLDGTTNYLSGVDHFSVSVALVEKGLPILALVLKPVSSDLWTCIKGEGLYYKGEKLQQVSPTLEPSQALYVTGFPYRSPDVFENFFDCAGKVLLTGRGMRRSGSAALDVCHVASGWLQGFWESDLQPYDIAAGMLFMEENGCVVTNGDGKPYDMFKDRMMVAALPKVHVKLLETVYDTYGSLKSR